MIRGFSPAILVLSLIFLVKALYLAFFVTPLWDIPDEIGHYSYALDIAEGRGIPKLGSSMIPAQVMEHVTHKSNMGPQGNWIAQHPPLYYILAAVPLEIGMSFTSDPEILFRLPRIIAAISGALLILVLYKTIKLIGLDDYRATLLGAAIGFIPMVSHLSSGTNHDMTLFLFSACGVFFFTRYIVARQVRDVYLSAVWVTLAGGIKMTAWVIIPPLLLIYALEISGPVKYWFGHMTGVGALMLVSPVIWMSRNFVLFADPVYTASTNTGRQLSTPLPDTFFDYVRILPVYDHLLLHFYGLIGWIGSGGGIVKIFAIAGAPRAFFSLLLLVVALLLIVSLVQMLHKILCVSGESDSIVPYRFNVDEWLNRSSIRKGYCLFLLLLALISGSLIYLESYPVTQIFGWFRIFFAVAIVVLGLTSVLVLPFELKADNYIFLYSLIVFLFFSCILLSQLYGIYVNEGRFGAIHGRYFYPVLPFLVMAVSVSVQRLYINKLSLVLLVFLLVLMEMESFIIQVLPFYEGGV